MSALPKLLERIAAEQRRAWRRPTPPSRRAPSAPSRPRCSVPPVMITSSPTIAILSRTRPVISVTATASCAGRVLCMIANSRLDHLGEADGHLRAAGVGRDRDDAFAGETEVAEVAREQRQRGHVVDRDREEALDLARVQVHRQHAVGAGELEHVGDEARRRSARAASPCGPGASTGTAGRPP